MADYTDVKQADGTVRRTFKKGSYGKGTGRKQRVIVVGKPVDPFATAAASAATQKYAPAEEQLTVSQRAQAQRSQDVAGWYDTYKQQVAQATQQNQAAAQAGQANLTALGASVGANDRAGQAQIQAQMQADAQARGASVDPNVGARMLEGSAVRGGNLASSQALQAFQALQQGTVDRQKGVAGEGLRVSALQSSAAKSSDLERQAAELAKEKGAFRVDYRDKLADDAKKQALEDFITKETLGIKKTTATAQVTAAKAKVASTKTAAKEKAAAPNQYGYSNADWGKMTPAQRQAAIKDFKKNTALPKDPKAKKPVKVKPSTGLGSLTPVQAAKYAGTVPKLAAALAKQTPDQLVASGPYSPEVNRTLVRAAMDIKAYDAVTPATVKRLHDIGVQIRGNFKQISAEKARAIAAANSVLDVG